LDGLKWNGEISLAWCGAVSWVLVGPGVVWCGKEFVAIADGSWSRVRKYMSAALQSAIVEGK